MQQGPNQQPPQIIVVQKPLSALRVLWILFVVFFVVPMTSCAACVVYGKIVAG